MAVELIAKIKPKNGGDFPLVDASDVDVNGKRLDAELTEIKNTTGTNGKDGEDGFSPTVIITKTDGVTTIRITDVNGEHIGKVNDGTNGANGRDGVDGKTPVKGEDYFTEADKTELVNDVIAALPVWEGGSY